LQFHDQDSLSAKARSASIAKTDDAPGSRPFCGR
jgi:hypothetical protein